MFLSDASLRRPVAMACLLIALAGLGFNAYRKMALELMPKMDVPYITVTTVWPGATPSDLETDVAKRIEDAVSAVDGLKHVTSICMENVVNTVLEFHLGVDVNVVATDVREKIDLEMSKFPEGVEKPMVQKFDINATPIVTLVLTGDLPVDDLYDYADNTLKDRLSVISGVANVELLGGAEREVHVRLDRDALAAAGLSSVHILQALREGVNSTPAGRVRDYGSEYSVRFDAEYSSVRDIASLQVAGRDGARRYLRDLGEVTLGTEERRTEAFLDGKQGISIRIVKKADANAVEVVENVRDAVERLRTMLPGGMKLVWVSDEGSFIQATVDSTTGNIWQGILLTAAILFFFLYNFRSTFVVAISMPLTIVISLFFLNLLEFSLNISTLLAIGLSVGILVTNSLVVLESVVSRFREGSEPWEAARRGTADVAIAVIASAGTNVVVLLPIGLMGGLMGIFFRPFALTALSVNLVSLFISFTLTPILCAVLLRAGGRQDSFLNRMERRWNTLLQKAAEKYAAFLRRLVARRWVAVLCLCLVAGIFAHSLSLMPRIGFSFSPEIDRGEVFVKFEYPTRQDLSRSVERIQEAEALLRDLPELRHLYSSVGKVDSLPGQVSEGVYLAQMLLKFSDKTKRAFGMDDILDEIRRRLRNYPDSIVTVNVGDLIGGQSMPVELEVAGEEFVELDRIALAIQEMAKGLPGFVDPDTSVREGKPELRVIPRRAILSDSGMSPQSLGVLLRSNLEGMKGGVYRSGARTFDIRVKLAEREGKKQVEEFQIPGSSGMPVMLAGFADIEERRAPVQVTRSDKQRVAKVFSNLLPGVPLGTAGEMLTNGIGRNGLLPPGYEARLRGDYERMGDAGAEFGEAMVLAIFLTYLTLSAIMESFKRPLLILATIPLALIGVLWALFLTGESMSIFVLLGTVMLVGIVVNNAILVMDRMQTLRAGGVESREAMLQALVDQFRPVVMITLAAVLGMLPLAIARGLGSELNNGIGIASAGGIAISGILALFVVPLIHLVGVSVRRDLMSRSRRKAPVGS